MSWGNYENIVVGGVKIPPRAAFSLDYLAYREVRENHRQQNPRTDFFVHETAHTLSMGYRDIQKSGKKSYWVSKFFSMKVGTDQEKRRQFQAQYLAAWAYYNERTKFYIDNPAAEHEPGW